jgi:DNA-binding transcriptional LysR family regulator
MVAGARQAVESVEGLQSRPIGELRVSAPAGFTDHLATAFAPFLEKHPLLTLHLTITDEAVAIVRERIDLAITLARPLRDSGLVRRHLADWRLVLCAAPAYLERRGVPRSPQDLAAHDFLSLPSGHHSTDVLTGRGGRQFRLQVNPRIVANNHDAIRQLTLHGAGLSFNVEPEVAHLLRAGRLVRVLRSWTTEVLSVDVLMPARSPQPAKVRMAIRALDAYVKSLR